MPDRPQTEITTIYGRHTDIGSSSISGDACICGTFYCRLHRLPASRRASRPFRHMCRKPVAWLPVFLQPPSILDRGELSVPRWHEQFHAAAYPELSQADYEGRSIQRSQFVDHGICTHPADVSSSPIRTTNPEVHASEVPFQQWLSIPANPYIHFQQIPQSSTKRTVSSIGKRGLCSMIIFPNFQPGDSV